MPSQTGAMPTTDADTSSMLKPSSDEVGTQDVPVQVVVPPYALEAIIDVVAARAAEIVSARMSEAEGGRPDVRYLDSADAAKYLGVSAKRVYDLRSMRALEPDGYDGRKPLYTRETLEHYVAEAR